jgi:sulfur relay (sulfurtransferase) complex TusBCD TusD component (DsrE family)
MKVLFIINDPPYGTERMYNALRMAGAFLKDEANQVSVFLMADAVSGAKAGQKTPDGYYREKRRQSDHETPPILTDKPGSGPNRKNLSRFVRMK